MDHTSSTRKWRHAQPEEARVATRKWAKANRWYWSAYSKRHRQQKRAWNRLTAALKLGGVVRPKVCERCGTACKPHGHHPDYSKPLEVIWLCYPCHLAEHGKQPLTKAAVMAGGLIGVD
jgi:hypothetical protein